MKSYSLIDSPVGELLLVAAEDSLLAVLYRHSERTPAVPKDWIHHDHAKPLPSVRKQLDRYFAGKLYEFDVPLLFEGTAFQQRVWRELQNIPYGTTISYGELARRIGNPNASRAVGLANGQNPISIIVPCHRVIGSNGTLTGYGGGLRTKKALLDLEAGAVEGRPSQPALFEVAR